MNIYPWLVFVHLVGLVLFLLAHGVSMFAAFRVRRERDRGTITTLLMLSSTGSQASYLGLILLGIGGLGAAWQGSLLMAPWVVGSYVIIAIVLFAMYAIGASYYYALRESLNGTERNPRLDDAQLIARLESRRPEALAAVGSPASSCSSGSWSSSRASLGPDEDRPCPGAQRPGRFAVAARRGHR